MDVLRASLETARLFFFFFSWVKHLSKDKLSRITDTHTPSNVNYIFGKLIAHQYMRFIIGSFKELFALNKRVDNIPSYFLSFSIGFLVSLGSYWWLKCCGQHAAFFVPAYNNQCQRSADSCFLWKICNNSDSTHD